MGGLQAVEAGHAGGAARKCDGVVEVAVHGCRRQPRKQAPVAGFDVAARWPRWGVGHRPERHHVRLIFVAPSHSRDARVTAVRGEFRASGAMMKSCTGIGSADWMDSR